MKVLNLYSGIGGNRKLWKNVKVTAVEINESIAKIYQDYFPKDKVIVGDAHQYLLKHYQEFDFIWSSPPCQTHSKIRKAASKRGDYLPKFPNMKLWQEIIFLRHFAKCGFAVENVLMYYDPLIRPSVELQRHYFWTNFKISPFPLDKIDRIHNNISSNTILYGFDIRKYKINNRKDQIIRNTINPDLGLYVFEQFLGYQRKIKYDQPTFF